MSLLEARPQARTPHPRRKRFHYFSHKSEFVVALHATSYHGHARMIVLNEVATGRFVVVTEESFKRDWLEC